MKILRIIYDWPPPWIGLSPQPYEITVSQTKKGHELTVMCGRWPKAGALEVPENVKVFPIWRAPTQGTLFLTSSVLLFFKYLKWRRKNKPDVLHIHGHFGLWILVYRNILYKFFPWSSELDIVLVSHFHNTAQGRWETTLKENKDIKPLSKNIEWPLMVLSDKLLCTLSSACIFVSNALKEEAIKYYNVKSEKCFVVETGVNVERFTPISLEELEKTRNDLGFDLYDKIILNYGFIVERKNVHLLIEAMQHLPHEYKLILLGTSDPSYMERLNEMILKYRLEGRVIKMGYTPYPHIPVAVQASDILVLPSSYEGMPKVATEALACGKPVIGSGFKLSNQIQGMYYLHSLDPKNIAEMIEDTLSESQKSKVDVSYVHAYYSWERKVEEIEKVYQYAFTHKVR